MLFFQPNKLSLEGGKSMILRDTYVSSHHQGDGGNLANIGWALQKHLNTRQSIKTISKPYHASCALSQVRTHFQEETTRLFGFFQSWDEKTELPHYLRMPGKVISAFPRRILSHYYNHHSRYSGIFSAFSGTALEYMSIHGSSWGLYTAGFCISCLLLYPWWPETTQIYYPYGSTG